jgi:hypothetical protein
VSGGPGRQSPEQLLLVSSVPVNAAAPVAPPVPPPDNAAEKTRRRGRPRRREMTLSGLHQKFLRYCEGERRLSPQTVVAYRSDFSQFVEALRAQSRWGLMSKDVVGTLSIANVRLYQYAMAGQGGESSNGPAPPGIAEPLRVVARPLWTPGGQPAGEHRVPTEGAAVAARTRLELGRASDRRRDAPARAGDSEFAGLWRTAPRGSRGVEGRRFLSKRLDASRAREGQQDRVVVLPRIGGQALAKYLASRPTASADAALFVTAAGKPVTYRAVTERCVGWPGGSGSTCIRTCSGTATRPSCSSVAPTSGTFGIYSVTSRWRPRRSTRT